METATFDQYRRVVYEATGISLGPGKQALVASRLGKRLRALGIDDHREYLRRVEADAGGAEMTQLVDCICTNVTSFFREEGHFDFIRATIQGAHERGQRKFRIWSAACSTGEEVYSLAMSLCDLTCGGQAADLKILGTDLSTKALKAAMEGRYTAQRVAGLHPELLSTHFTREQNGRSVHYQIRPELAALAVFRQANLARPPLRIAGPLDVIFCRNVMIYFDRPVRERLVADMIRLLKPGGHLIVGHAESLSGIRHELQPVEPSIYRKR